MTRRTLLPALLAILVGASPAHAWTWPANGPVLQPFTFADDPYAAGLHRGIDVAAPAGTAVRAPAAGTVSFAGTVPRHGRTVTIQTADGYAVTLVHLGGIAVSRGSPVAEGATVGTIGSSGEPEHGVPYVHLGVRVTAEPEGYVDPLLLLPPRELAPAGPSPDGKTGATGGDGLAAPVGAAAAAAPEAAEAGLPVPEPAAADGAGVATETPATQPTETEVPLHEVAEVPDAQPADARGEAAGGEAAEASGADASADASAEATGEAAEEAPGVAGGEAPGDSFLDEPAETAAEVPAALETDAPVTAPPGGTGEASTEAKLPSGATEGTAEDRAEDDPVAAPEAAVTGVPLVPAPAAVSQAASSAAGDSAAPEAVGDPVATAAGPGIEGAGPSTADVVADPDASAGASVDEPTGSKGAGDAPVVPEAAAAGGVDATGGASPAEKGATRGARPGRDSPGGRAKSPAGAARQTKDQPVSVSSATAGPQTADPGSGRAGDAGATRWVGPAALVLAVLAVFAALALRRPAALGARRRPRMPAPRAETVASGARACEPVRGSVPGARADATLVPFDCEADVPARDDGAWLGRKLDLRLVTPGGSGIPDERRDGIDRRRYGELHDVAGEPPEPRARRRDRSPVSGAQAGCLEDERSRRRRHHAACRAPGGQTMLRPTGDAVTCRSDARPRPPRLLELRPLRRRRERLAVHDRRSPAHSEVAASSTRRRR